ncbi:hypothetical protein [Caenibacillus caldisaponilyticus]|uniref:hypothetical protein n=1 Tax=Caenibacillus caldisaponilyticus TaxID=1674942 RepID=UPI00098853DF|nr:hypothetical protein [Caenibacillus caldisaponilyticus]
MGAFVQAWMDFFRQNVLLSLVGAAAVVLVVAMLKWSGLHLGIIVFSVALFLALFLVGGYFRRYAI